MELKNLKELGLSDGQISVYSAVLDLGITGLNKIQEKTGIERRNIYDILNKLIEKGLVSYTVEKGKKTFQCTHPNKLLEEIKKKEDSLKDLKQQIPQIKDLFDISKPDIRAEVFRGSEAMKALLNEALEYKASHWIGGNSGVYNTPLKHWWETWMKRRVEKKHVMYDLADYGKVLKDFKIEEIEKNKKNLYKYHQLPEHFSSPMVIIIFGNKVAQVLWTKKPFAFVLESEEIKDSFMKYFNYFWKDPW
jgi:HTH-type transcriptional regulator, sugar sensing transcriptional regulator